MWSMVGALSEASVAAGSKRMDIPDMTDGRWKQSVPHPVNRSLDA